MYNPDDLHLRRALASRTQPFGLSHIPYTPSNQENFQKFQEFLLGCFGLNFRRNGGEFMFGSNSWKSWEKIRLLAEFLGIIEGR